MSSGDEVRKASTQFYEALNRMANGESGTMEGVWLHGDTVTAMHPIGGCEVGWGSVASSFDSVAKLASNGKVKLKDQHIRIAGDCAVELGVEEGEFEIAGHPVKFEVRVTNVYQKQDGTWRVVHHHTDTSPAMLEVLSKL